MLGVINGSFYAMLSLSRAIIFGLLNVSNFANDALYMMSASLAWIEMDHLYGLLLTFCCITLRVGGHLSLILRRLQSAVFSARSVVLLYRPRLYGAYELSRLGSASFAGGVFFDLIRDRKNQIGRLPARRY